MLSRATASWSSWNTSIALRGFLRNHFWNSVFLWNWWLVHILCYIHYLLHFIGNFRHNFRFKNFFYIQEKILSWKNICKFNIRYGNDSKRANVSSVKNVMQKYPLISWQLVEIHNSLKTEDFGTEITRIFVRYEKFLKRLNNCFFKWYVLNIYIWSQSLIC